jgi:hypothetical protein
MTRYCHCVVILTGSHLDPKLGNGPRCAGELSLTRWTTSWSTQQFKSLPFTNGPRCSAPNASLALCSTGSHLTRLLLAVCPGVHESKKAGRSAFQRVSSAGKSLSRIEGRHWKATFSAHVRWGEHGAPVQNHRPWLQEEFGRIPFELELKRKPQISPLRCAPVEMTILFEEKFSGFQEKCALWGLFGGLFGDRRTVCRR